MRIISALNKGLQAIIADINTPQSFKVGQAFEEYVRKELFIERYYDLLERTHDYQANRKDFVEASIKPDFKFRDRLTRKEFYVEAKFRSKPYQGKIVWCTEKQLYRYQEYNKQKPVFVILGMGEEPKCPDTLALIPLSSAKYTGLFPSYAERFQVELDKEISSRILWNR